MSRSRSVQVFVVLILGLFFSTGAFAQSVLQTVTVKVKSGQQAAYAKQIASLQGVMKRLGVDAQITNWNAIQAGTATGNTLVSISYPSLVAYAEATTKSTADPEWQKIIGGLDGIRTVVSTGLLTARDGGGVTEAAPSGSVLQGVLVQVNPGQLDAYMKKVEMLKGVQKRLGSTSTMRVWQATVAGQNTGVVAVGITHASLSAYAENATKLSGDAEAQKLLGGLDSIRSVVSSSLYVRP